MRSTTPATASMRRSSRRARRRRLLVRGRRTARCPTRARAGSPTACGAPRGSSPRRRPASRSSARRPTGSSSTSFTSAPSPPRGPSPRRAEHLPELAELGITAIEIMPVPEFPGARGWGYDGVYLSAAQSSYGGPLELAALVAAAHRAGLAVILDVVYNHIGASRRGGVRGLRPVLHEYLRDPVGEGDQLRRCRLRPGPRMGAAERRGVGARLRDRRAAARRDPRDLRRQRQSTSSPPSPGGSMRSSRAPT